MTSPNLETDYFSLFALPQQFDVDLVTLGSRYRELQRQFHPDRFVSEDERQQRLAVQISARLNDGFATLKSPLKRALYLLRLRGLDLSDQDRRVLAPAFLMVQMSWRERLESLSEISAEDALELLDALDDEVTTTRKETETSFVTALETEADLDKAAEKVRELQFIDKMQLEIEQLEERLTDD